MDPPAKDDSVERTAWTPEEVRTFLHVAAADRLGAVWRLALTSGLRRGELCGLTWDSVDLSAGAITVARQVLVRPHALKGEPRLYVRETTKTRKRRVVRVGVETTTALRRWKAEQSAERLEFGPAYRPDGSLGVEAAWIVTEPHGFVVHPDTLLHRWQSLVKQAGVTPITLHGARHTYAELSLKGGARLDVVSRQLGHASLATTANIYLHDDQAAAADAADRLADVLEGGR